MEIKIEQLKTFSPGITQAINNLLIQLNPDLRMLTDENLKKIIAEPSNFLFVARDSGDNKIVGMAMITIINTLARKKAMLEELVVDEKFRGNGIGEKLINVAVNNARGVGATCIEFTSNPKRIRANELYQKLGFKKRDTNVYRIEL